MKYQCSTIQLERTDIVYVSIKFKVYSGRNNIYSSFMYWRFLIYRCPDKWFVVLSLHTQDLSNLGAYQLFFFLDRLDIYKLPCFLLILHPQHKHQYQTDNSNNSILSPKPPPNYPVTGQYHTMHIPRGFNRSYLVVQGYNHYPKNDN